MYVDEVEGALWSYERIEQLRVAEFPLERRRRVVVAIDPSGARGREDEGRDEIGIVVAVRGDDGHAYVLADRSLRNSPAVWGRVAVKAFHEFEADCIIAEENFGGDMVRFVIRTADPGAPVRVIHASRGKAVRAEPVSALYEQGMVHHVGRFGTLEDQLCGFTTLGYRGEDSPDHADALVWAITDLMLSQPDGWGLLEYYRREADATKTSTTAKATPPSATTRLRAPLGTSTVYGVTGRQYLVGADGLVEVTDEDAKPLVAQGFDKITEPVN